MSPCSRCLPSQWTAVGAWPYLQSRLRPRLWRAHVSLDPGHRLYDPGQPPGFFLPDLE